MKIFKEEGQEPRFQSLAKDYSTLVNMAEELNPGPNWDAVDKLINSVYNEICEMVTREFADLAIKEIDADHPTIIDMVTAVKYHLEYGDDPWWLYRVGVLDSGGGVVGETQPLTKGEIIENIFREPDWLFKFLHETGDSHHLVIYRITGE